jgi:ankyrin repeat protein
MGQKTPLMAAAGQGDLDGIAKWVSTGAPLDEADGDGWTALMHAAGAGRTMAVVALAKAGCQLDVRNYKGATALMVAAESGCEGALSALVKAGADIDASDAKGRTAVSIAAISEIGCWEVLLAAGCKLGEGGEDALLAAMACRKWENAKKLVGAGANLEARDYLGYTPLLIAAREGSEDMARTLLDAGAKIGPGGMQGATALHFAAISGNPACLARILAVGPDLESRCETEGQTAAYFAAVHDNHECLSMLIAAGASWDALDVYSESPLDRALKANSETCRAMARAELERRAIASEAGLAKGPRRIVGARRV